LELASAMLFDIGVLMVVVGITLVILIRLGNLHALPPPATAPPSEDKP
jgi:multisubunit Na+/H+ antiporter MnhB subunit